MPKFTCPMSDIAICHIKDLTGSYKDAIEVAAIYNSVALANKKQIENALGLADKLRCVIESYICSWENGAPCLNYSCGWEYCQRNLQILNSLPNLPDLPRRDYNADINISTTDNSPKDDE